MRIKHLLSLAAFAAVLLPGCEKEESPASNITVTPVEISDAPMTENEQVVTLTADGAWSAAWQDTDAILDVAPREGGAVTNQRIRIRLAANSGTDRTLTIRFGSSRLNSKTVTIHQKGEKGESDVEKISVAEFIRRADTDTDYRLEGTIDNIANSSYYGFDLTDDTGTIAIAFPTNFRTYVDQLEEGGVVLMEGKYAFYADKQTHQMQNGTIVRYTAPAPVDPSTIETVTVAEFLQRADPATYYRLSGTIASFNSQYTSFDLVDETGSVYVYSLSPASLAAYKGKLSNGDEVTLYGKYFYYANDDKAEIKNAVIENHTEKPVVKVTIEGLVMAVSARSFIVSTEDGIRYVYSEDNPNVSVGDRVSVEGEESFYNGLPQLSNPVTAIVSSGNEVSYPEPEELDAAALDAYDTPFGYVKFTGMLAKSGDYLNVNVPGATRTGSIAYAAQDYSEFNGKTVDVTGYFVGISGTVYFNVIVTDLALSENQIDDSLSHPLTSGVTWTLGSKAYDNTSTGNNKQSGTFNGIDVDNLLKLGTSSAGGDATLLVPAGSTRLCFYAVGFSKDLTDGKTPFDITVKVGDAAPVPVRIARYIASGNAPYTLSLSDQSDYYTVDFDELASAAEVSIETPLRCLFIGINAE